MVSFKSKKISNLFKGKSGKTSVEAPKSKKDLLKILNKKMMTLMKWS